MTIDESVNYIFNVTLRGRDGYGFVNIVCDTDVSENSKEFI